MKYGGRDSQIEGGKKGRKEGRKKGRQVEVKCSLERDGNQKMI